MPTYPNLNRDFSATGGVMDRPDLTVRTAALKLSAGAPLTGAEFRRIATRQYLEEDNARLGAGGASFAPSDPRGGTVPAALLGVRPAGPGGDFGPSGPIDVRSYAGSRYSAANAMPAALRGTPAPNSLEALPGVYGVVPKNDRAPLDRGVTQLENERAAAAFDVHMADSQQRLEIGRSQFLRQQQQDAANAARAQQEEAALGNALKPSGSPSVDQARQTRGVPTAGPMALGPAGTVGAPGTVPAVPAIAREQPAVSPDNEDLGRKYFMAGGRDHALAKTLSGMSEFIPTKVNVDGTSMVKNTPRSAIPDTQQPRAKTPQEPTSEQPIKSSDGKFYKSHAADNWHPIREEDPNMQKLLALLAVGTDPEMAKAWNSRGSKTPSAEAPAVAPAPAAPATTPAAPAAGTFETPEAVRAAYRNGALTRDAAAAILQKQFGHK